MLFALNKLLPSSLSTHWSPLLQQTILKQVQGSQDCSRTREHDYGKKSTWKTSISTLSRVLNGWSCEALRKEHLYAEKSGILEKNRIKNWDRGSYPVLWIIGSVTLSKTFNFFNKVIFQIYSRSPTWDSLFKGRVASNRHLTQYNTISDSWSKYTDLNMYCMTVKTEYKRKKSLLLRN